MFRTNTIYQALNDGHPILAADLFAWGHMHAVFGINGNPDLTQVGRAAMNTNSNRHDLHAAGYLFAVQYTGYQVATVNELEAA